MRRTLLLVLLLAALAVVAVGLLYQRDLRAAQARLAAGTSLATTAFGPVAYAEGGQGAPVLAIHGAGGGHDQGRLLAEAFLPAGHHWIAPSRFGYPGSPMPDDPSTAAQADALAGLLDLLGTGPVTVLAMSGGVPPALQLARRHPDRVRGLILLSLAPFAPLTIADQHLPVPAWVYDWLFASDLPLWAVLSLAPRRLGPIFDARPDLTARMTAEEGAFLDAMIAAFLPVTRRRAGLANEGAAIDPAGALDLTALEVPVLIVHARDDRITPVSTADFAGATIPGAQSLFLTTGGHLLLGHHAEVRRRIAAFLAAPSLSGAD